TTYTYRVKAYSGTGESLYSNEATTTTIIPVELTSFAASVGTDNQISVVWSTATELNNSGFNLERKLDSEWQKVAFIEGKGTTTEKTEYSFVDKFKYESFQGTIQYRLKQIDFDGTSSYSKVASVEVDFTPKEYTLFQNYPNPFNPSTTIKFALPFDSNVRIAVYNLIGEQVEVIFDQVKEVGYHNISWNASSLASGVYIYTIEAKSLDGLQKFNSVKKMMLVK
ncbi:MAG: T9SS type A sorting domain-containing protein, partial [Ignavibacteriaceae bacterium]